MNSFFSFFLSFFLQNAESLSNIFFHLIESMRPRHWVFEAFNLDEEQQEDGWMKQGHPYVGKNCRRIYEGEGIFFLYL